MTNSKADKAAGRVLLPSYVQPTRYDLKVKPDLINYTFDGLVAIEMLSGENFTNDESKKITLHAKELMFRTAEFQTSDGKVVKADEVSIFCFLFPLPLLLNKNRHLIVIEFFILPIPPN